MNGIKKKEYMIFSKDLRKKLNRRLMQMEDEKQMAEKILEKCMPKPIDTETKLKEILE